MKQWVFILISFSLFAASCDNTPEAEPAGLYGLQYFPLDTSKFILYDVVEITIDKPVNVYDTLHYQLMERYSEPYTDNSGNLAYKMERWVRDDDLSNFTLSDVWVAQVSDQSAQTVEENVRFVKIRFPARPNRSWNGNVFNIYESQEYYITNIDKAAEINGFSFDSTLTVVQQLDSSLIHKNDCIEIYAKNIGLVFKQKININSQEVIPNVDIDDRITTGTKYYQKIIGFGIN
ncbi:MAG: hypothetical protein KBB11_09595 [Bacteroidales bacterium]|nr:hypothetical protein [Bacteroidales bacterium]HOY39572.1 hypothetical protein [Bacteroidales bacterium]HQP03288.1 hypothetical protein [Bacteroidales bacterium]